MSNQFFVRLIYLVSIKILGFHTQVINIQSSTSSLNAMETQTTDMDISMTTDQISESFSTLSDSFTISASESIQSCSHVYTLQSHSLESSVMTSFYACVETTSSRVAINDVTTQKPVIVKGTDDRGWL